MDNKKAMVVISFGSTFDETRTHDIGGIEQALAAAFPAYDHFRAFTSVIIRKRLAGVPWPIKTTPSSSASVGT